MRHCRISTTNAFVALIFFLLKQNKISCQYKKTKICLLERMSAMTANCVKCGCVAPELGICEPSLRPFSHSKCKGKSLLAFAARQRSRSDPILTMKFRCLCCAETFVGDVYTMSALGPYYFDFVRANKVQVLWKPWCFNFFLPVVLVVIATMLAIKKMF